MAITPVNLTFDLGDLLDNVTDANRTKVWIETNIEDDAIVDPDGNSIRLGIAKAVVGSDGTGSFTGLVPTNAATTSPAFQYRVWIDYPLAYGQERARGGGNNGRGKWNSGWFSLAATSDLADVVAEQYVPPTYVTQVTQQLDAKVAEAEGYAQQARDISQIDTTDDAVDAALKLPGGKAASTLSASYAVVIKPEQYGAVGDGVADDTEAVEDAFAAATAMRTAVIGGNVHGPGATVVLEGTYNLATLAATIVASCNLDGSRGTLVVPNAYASAVILVGHETSAHCLANASIDLPSITKPGATSFAAGSIGAKIQNLYHSRVKGRRVDFFELGWLVTGLGMGTAYNDIGFGWTDLCKVAWKLAPTTGGWVNSNRFLGGGISQSTNTLDGSGIRRTGWRHIVIDGSAGAGTVNSNTFDGISFEGDLSEFYFDIKTASNNTWLGATRFEQGTVARSVTLSTDSFTDAGHGLAVGDMVVFFATTALAKLMKRGEAYYVHSVPSSSTFKVSETRGGPAVSFASNGTGLVYYVPPRIKIDGTGGFTYANEIKSGYYAYPGQLDIRETNATHSNPVGPSLPRRDTAMPGRNRIVNGDFRINQRGYASGASLAVGAFCFDRWKSNLANTTLTFTSAPQGQLVVLDGFVQQVIERGELPAGTYTLSWDGNATARVYRSGDSAPSLANGPITIDLDGTTDVVVEFFGNGQTLGNVQLELGRVPTAFEQDSIASQLAKCKRYFQRLGTGTSGREPVGMGIASATTAALFTRALAVEMRATPTLTVTSAATFRMNLGGSIVTPSAISLDSTSTARSVRLSVSAVSGLTAGGALYIDTGDGYLDFSAEL